MAAADIFFHSRRGRTLQQNLITDDGTGALATSAFSECGNYFAYGVSLSVRPFIPLITEKVSRTSCVFRVVTSAPSTYGKLVLRLSIRSSESMNRTLGDSTTLCALSNSRQSHGLRIQKVSFIRFVICASLCEIPEALNQYLLSLLLITHDSGILRVHRMARMPQMTSLGRRLIRTRMQCLCIIGSVLPKVSAHKRYICNLAAISEG